MIFKLKDIETNIDLEIFALPLEDSLDINYNTSKSVKLNAIQYSVFILLQKKRSI